MPKIRCHESRRFLYNEDRCDGLLLPEKGSNVDATSPANQSEKYGQFEREHGQHAPLHVDGFPLHAGGEQGSYR
ncbi:Uncharacterised protein [Vibrio cholerae]|nr:Uncharacterised protein [Vibrio cholerae]